MSCGATRVSMNTLKKYDILITYFDEFVSQNRAMSVSLS